LFKPTQIGTAKWRDISISGHQKCAIKLDVDTLGNPLADDQSLWCWGTFNSDGQLGIGNNTSIYNQPTSKVLSPLTTQVKWLTVSSANYNTCAITTSYKLYCWGSGGFQLLGTGGISDVHKPTTAVTPVSGAAVNWVEVKIGSLAVCALTDTKKLYCWGQNYYGEVGPAGLQRRPFLITAGSGLWSNFDVGGYHACAIDLSDSKLWCWGRNDSGQLATGKFGQTASVPKGTPEQVKTLGNNVTWNQVATGNNFTCATRTDDPLYPNSVWCWGENGYGVLANKKSWSLKPISVSFP